MLRAHVSSAVFPYQLVAATLAMLVFGPAAARADAPGSVRLPFPSDPVVDRLVEESLAARPELKQAEASLRAEQSRIPQAGALPDPVLSLGIQNDGFESIQIGDMETSFYQVMVSQALPWPGKRGLRTAMAEISAEQAEAGLRRARLTTEADARRAYVDLLLVRDRLRLLSELQGLWEKSAGVARARYEAGEAAQSDLLRSQLELTRLRQRVLVLQADERTTVQNINRMRDHPLDDPIATTSSVRHLGVPELTALEQAQAEAMAQSPELALARLGASRARKETDLARRERFPDVNVNFGVMPRGDLDPMWAAGISVSVPLWSYRKQGPAIDESRARYEAEASSAQAVEQILRLRVAERHAALDSLLAVIRPYRDGLLVQSQATAESTLSQYRVGAVSFASVLEANAGYINDEESFLSALADAQRVAIADAELSLQPLGLGAAGVPMGSATMPGAGAARMSSVPAPPKSGAASRSEPSVSGMPSGM